MIGYIGMGLLIVAYILFISKFKKWFIPVDAVASLLLTIHAIVLSDIPFMVVNGIVTIMLTIKIYKKELV
jgi:hypothetical protein